MQIKKSIALKFSLWICIPLVVILLAASALLLDPSMKERVVIVWLGGNGLHMNQNREFNLYQDVAAARGMLEDILSNYQGFRKCVIILVFDAYKVKGNPGSIEKRNGIYVAYTKEAETADAYIEKASYQMRKQYRVRVATSDGMEQLIILGHGA